MRTVSPQARMAAAAARRMQAMPAPAMPGMKKGGMCHAKGGVTRADGCAQRGKTRGRMV